MLSKLRSLFSSKDIWSKTYEILEANDEKTWQSFHFAVNPPSLIADAQERWRPPVRVFDFQYDKNKSLQWLGSKNTKKNKLYLAATDLPLSSAEALSEMLRWNSCAGALILEVLRDMSELFNMPRTDALPLRLSEEDRAIEWMRVSFDLLKKAIGNCPNEYSDDRDSTFFSQSFMATRGAIEQQTQIRLICFNLDILLCPIQSDGLWTLEVVIYNHKNATAQAPALNVHFNHRQKAALDLVASILEASKQHFYWPLT